MSETSKLCMIRMLVRHTINKEGFYRRMVFRIELSLTQDWTEVEAFSLSDRIVQVISLLTVCVSMHVQASRRKEISEQRGGSSQHGLPCLAQAAPFACSTEQFVFVCASLLLC